MRYILHILTAPFGNDLKNAADTSEYWCLNSWLRSVNGIKSVHPSHSVFIGDQRSYVGSRSGLKWKFTFDLNDRAHTANQWTNAVNSVDEYTCYKYNQSKSINLRLSTAYANSIDKNKQHQIPEWDKFILPLRFSNRKLIKVHNWKSNRVAIGLSQQTCWRSHKLNDNIF